MSISAYNLRTDILEREPVRSLLESIVRKNNAQTEYYRARAEAIREQARNQASAGTL